MPSPAYQDALDHMNKVAAIAKRLRGEVYARCEAIRRERELTTEELQDTNRQLCAIEAIEKAADLRVKREARITSDIKKVAKVHATRHATNRAERPQLKWKRREAPEAEQRRIEHERYMREAELNWLMATAQAMPATGSRKPDLDEMESTPAEFYAILAASEESLEDMFPQFSFTKRAAAR